MFVCVISIAAPRASFGLGKKYDTRAVPGYSLLTAEGSQIFDTLVSDRKWANSGEGELRDGSEKKIRFSQSLEFRHHSVDDLFWYCGQMFGGEEYNMLSATDAFGWKSSNESIAFYRVFDVPNQITDATILQEVTSDGSYRFLFRSQHTVRGAYPVAKYLDGPSAGHRCWYQNYGWELDPYAPDRASLAAVDPWLMNASDTVSVYPYDKICVGESCKPFSAFTPAQANVADEIVLEINPKNPERITVELYRFHIPGFTAIPYKRELIGKFQYGLELK